MGDVTPPAPGVMARLVAVPRSILYATIFYGGSFVIVASALIASWVSHRAVVQISRGWGRYHRWCARWIIGQRVRVTGGQFADVPVLYCFKHESAFETFETLALFAHPAVYGKEELLHIPMWGRVARMQGLIPVARDAGPAAVRAMVSAGRAAVVAGRPLCLFPEGTRVPHGSRPPLQAGFAALYKMLNIPVVPVALDSGRVDPPHRFVKYPGVITYRIGEAIPPGLDRHDVEARVHAAINVLNVALPGA